MKKISKFLSILLCLTIVLGLAAVVSAEEQTATMTASELGLENSAEFTSYTPASTPITFSGSQNDGSSKPAYYTSGTALRFYAKNSFTVSVASGYRIVTIVINGDKSNPISDSDESVKINNATAEGRGTATVTLTPTDGTAAVTITNIATKGNFRVASCTVTYAATDAPVHTHSYNETHDGAAAPVDGVSHSYSYTCTDSSCDNVKTETEAHTFGEDGKCTACGFEYTGISQILTAKNGSWAATGVVTYLKGKNVYIQDATGGICLYCAENPEGLSVGDVVTGTGSYADFKGLPELSGATCSKVTDSALTLTAKTTTIGELTTSDICTYVKIEDATVTAIDGSYTTIAQGENTINIFSAVTTSKLAVGDTLTITAAVGCYTDIQLVNTNASEIVVTSSANPSEGEGEENPPKTSYTGTLLSSLKDGDEVVIYSPYLKGLMSFTDYLYTSSSGNQKHELVSVDATVDGSNVSYGTGAIVLTVHEKDGVYSFTAPSGMYLYCDGTDVKFVSGAGENTQFVLEQAEGGFYVKCANATYNDKPQYLEVYNGYFTTYGMNESNAAQYVFQFYAADPETPRTGDTSLSMLVALMAVSALGIAVVTSKKKEF